MPIVGRWTLIVTGSVFGEQVRVTYLEPDNAPYKPDTGPILLSG